jgi:ABC-type multidrug transport system ATPase subunit
MTSTITSRAVVQHWPAISLTASPVTVGRTDSNTVQMQHASISRTHLKLIKTESGDWELQDLDSRFGTFVNGARVARVVLKPGDSVRIGSSPPYRYNGQALEVSPDGAGMTISLRDVGIIRDGRTLIQNINLTIPADSFTGVLGPSGAGKSLMLGTLSSTMVPTGGQVEFDEGMTVKENLDYYRSKIGIVTQDDIVYTDLTVFENLDFAAQIRLPDATPDDRAKRIDFALEAVGLLEHRDKRVGILSGGQRKRVSVAIELLIQPRLLLLDEPTSGLDPGMQARLMEMLRGVSRRGVTVVCTTHTLDTLNFFDQLLVLGLKDHVASVAYFGSPRELLPSFGVHTQMDLFDKLQTLSGATPAEQRVRAESE